MVLIDFPSAAIATIEPLVRKSTTEAATRGVLCKKVFLEISQNSQENTCARVYVQKMSTNKVTIQFIYKNETVNGLMEVQASACEKQGRAKIARLVTKFRGYRRVKDRSPPTK